MVTLTTFLIMTLVSHVVWKEPVVIDILYSETGLLAMMKRAMTGTIIDLISITLTSIILFLGIWVISPLIIGNISTISGLYPHCFWVIPPVFLGYISSVSG